MSEEAPGSAPPPSMVVHIDHDGVDWIPQRRTATSMVLGIGLGGATGVGAAMLAATAGMPSRLGAVLVGVAAGSLAALPFLASALRQEHIVLRPDRLWLGPPGPQREEILLREVTSVQVRHPPPGSDLADPVLLVRTAEGTHRLGTGNDPAHLLWFASAVERTRAQLLLLDRTQGPELFMHRERPKALEKLTE